MNTILERPAFVIHLQSSTDRTPFFMKNITEAGFKDIRIFDGVNGIDIDSRINAILKFDNIVFDTEPAQGVIGCALSHLCLLKYIIDNKIELSTVFEDDVWFHPDWKILSAEYYSETPSDFDVLFIGNGLDSCRVSPETTPKITTESCWCTHAYVITLEGAKKFLNALLNWDYKNFNHAMRGKTLSGLYCIDVMIKDTQNNILNKTIPQSFTWYCWNGTKYPYKPELFPIKGNDSRNTGLVFQATDDFESTVTVNRDYDCLFYDENKIVINISNYETTEQWIAKTFIPEDASVLELGGRYGVVSCEINKRLKDKTKHLVVEPDPVVFVHMVNNIVANRANCRMFNGIISRTPQYFQPAGLGSRTRCKPCSTESVLVPHMSLTDAIAKYGIVFDTLVADCEGCLESFFDENLDYIKNFKLITFEEDYGSECNYDKIKQILAQNNFECVRPGGHSVWVKKQIVEPVQKVQPIAKKKRFAWSIVKT